MSTSESLQDVVGEAEIPARDQFEPQLPENCVEYRLFVAGEDVDNHKQLPMLETVRKAALHLASSLTKDYIWQKDEFSLELQHEQGLVYLHGITDYGDAVEDEWLVVYILLELTKVHAELWVQVFETDGEFLLIEAANVLPKWVNPENDKNRVWLHDGKMMLISPPKETANRPKNLPLPEALDIISSKLDLLLHSEFVQSEALYRLEKYPAQIVDSTHCSLVTIPRKLTYVLHTLPKSVAPAIESFYLRDAISLKRILSPPGPLTFAPSDLVTISVRFSKVLFAQLRSQRFDTPPSWQEARQKIAKEASSGDPEKCLEKFDMGMKLTCGFEMLVKNAAVSKSRVAREFAIVLEDLEEDGDEALPSDSEIKLWKGVDQDDSEAWLDIDYRDFERELEGKISNGGKGAMASGFGDAKTQTDLRKIVSRFEAFLNDDAAGVDGAELDEMDIDDDTDDEDSEEEDKEVSFDEEEFARMMREMMGLPGSGAKGPFKGKERAVANDANKDDKSEGELDEEDDEIKKLASEMEAELNNHGALTLDPTTGRGGSSLEDASSSKMTSTSKNGARSADATKEEDESEDEVDIDYNLAKNLLESFKSQAGMAGPTGNLLGMMGFQLPRDEDDGENDEGK